MSVEEFIDQFAHKLIGEVLDLALCLIRMAMGEADRGVATITSP